MTAETDPDRLWTRDVAEMLKVSPATVRRWADAGKVPHYHTPGKRRRYQEHAIRQLARELGVEGGQG